MDLLIVWYSSANIYFLLWLIIFRRNKALVKELSKLPPGSSDLYFPTQYSQSTFSQFKFCLWKQWWAYWRSPDYNVVRVLFAVLTALLLGTIFWRVGFKMYVFIRLSYYVHSHWFFSWMYMAGSSIVSLFGAGRVQQIFWSSLDQCMLLCCLLVFRIA